MVMVKEKIKTLVDVMPTNEAEQLLSYITRHFQLTTPSGLWDSIEEVEPDDIDRQMMHEMESDPDCNEFVKS